MSQARFQEQLSRHLAFIANSCDCFDKGQRFEAIRIGTSLRALFHNTSQSTSLLHHLNATNVLLLSTCNKLNVPANALLFEGLLIPSAHGFGPKLEAAVAPITIPANDWWTQTVLVTPAARFTRKLIAVYAANKDGGAHVDEDLPPEYERLIDGIWTDLSNGAAIADHHLMYLRQMGYEILNSPALQALAV